MNWFQMGCLCSSFGQEEYISEYVTMYVCLRVCQVGVIKARGNVAVNLKLMDCSSGYCVWLGVIYTHTHTHMQTCKHGRHFSLQ